MKAIITIDDQKSILPKVEIEDGEKRREFFADPHSLLEVLAKGMRDAIPKQVLVIPPGLYATDNHEFAVWFRPAGYADIFVRFGKNDSTSLSVPLPALILNVNRRGDQRIMALKTDSPTQSTELFKAPFPNHTAGKVCMASGDKGKVETRWLESSEANFGVFFSSVFSSHTVAGKSTTYPSDVRELLADLDGKTEFPTDELISAEMTLAEFVEGSAR